ncbi:hypothetical protein [Streptomyces virginiae]|uniref:hypothetical protein n=1 Tax=Streptomyces virginiae TaxID=1961 RepID=UPI0022552017|nr:hypothetical protein [Streptomyces virginiae]MCX5274606.1 hypothetical protein [Streptomyces virginiae]
MLDRAHPGLHRRADARDAVRVCRNDSPRDACVEYLTDVRRLGGTAGGVAGPGVDASIGLPGLARPGVETGIGVLRPTLARAGRRTRRSAG